MLLRFVPLLCVLQVAFGCTSIIVGPDASADGTAWVGQSDDGEGAGDHRLVWVPPMHWPAGSMRPVIDYEDYPRYVGTERKIPDYFPSAQLPNATQNIIGHIAQVNYTFGYYEGNYAISNDQGVSFGESTTSAKIFAKSVAAGGPSLLSMYELSRLAAERGSSAKDAVQLMGDLAGKHGFWGDASKDTGGESILVTDGTDSFIFHVLPASEETGGAIWAAQRIPRDHAAVVSNAFVLGFIDTTDTENFYYSSNMHSIAQDKGWWDGKGMLHFTRAFSAGEYTSQHYAGRRMWGFWSTVAPSLKVPAEYKSYLQAVGTSYPVSAKPDHLLTSETVLRKVYRDYYKGTPYDLSAGPDAGAFNTPYRAKPGAGEASLAGVCGTDADGDSPCNRWERPIASFRSTLISLTQVMPAKPTVTWFLPGSALSGVFVPVIGHSKAVPSALGDVHNLVMDRSKAFWAFKELIQFAYPRWSLVETAIEEVGTQLEADGAAMVRQLLDSSSSEVTIARRCAEHVDTVVARWQKLYGELFIRYKDGWDYGKQKDGSLAANRVGYPAWWLKEVNYNAAAGPSRPKACKTDCE